VAKLVLKAINYDQKDGTIIIIAVYQFASKVYRGGKERRRRRILIYVEVLMT